MQERHALVVGASSSIGWTLVEEILQGYGDYTSVTTLTNRPLAKDQAGWKDYSIVQLQTVSGLDLASMQEVTIAQHLLTKAAYISSITDVFYCAFKQEDLPADEYRVNGEMMSHLVGALKGTAPKLSMFVVCAGTRYYHRQCIDKPLPAPFREEMIDWAAEDVREGVFYYAWEKELNRACKDQRWSWCAIVPDAIVGFAPAGSTFALPIFWATWLSAYALKEGQGATIAYPGSDVSYKAKFNSASSSQLAHQMVWAAQHPTASSGGQKFNVADSGSPSSMEEMWPRITAYFGLKGLPPPDNLDSYTMPSVYLDKHGDILKQNGLSPAQISKGSWLDLYGTAYTYDRHLSLDKVRAAGFTEERLVFDGWMETWDRMKAAKMIPQ